MFTGLVEGMGRIEAAESRSGETRFRIRPEFAMNDIRLGESIAVSGVCLTVESAPSKSFTAYASAETLSRTNLGGLRTGHRVNLERALAMGDRLGGHMVSGHVDCLAEVADVRTAGESTVYTLFFPAEFGIYVVEKGSVALDGISLTVNSCTDKSLFVNIIPETKKVTTIGTWKTGTAVNMEVDIIGKYVARMVAPHLDKKGAGPGSGLTAETLRRHGF